MPPLPEATVEFLGPEAARVVSSIEEPELRDRVEQAVTLCAEGLAAVDALDLSPHEITDDQEGQNLTVWNAVAPDVRQLLVTVGRVSETLRGLFPNRTETISLDPADIEAALSDMEFPIRDEREGEIDRLVQESNDLVGAEASVSQLASMLQFDFLAFGQRLRNPSVVADRWVLLGELQELKGKCTQCLEAIVATLVQPFTERSVQAIWPRYADATARARVLREKMVDLAYDIGVLHGKLTSSSGEDARAVRDALVARLNEFAGEEAYRFLRPADKRALSRFRIGLNAHEPDRRGVGEFRRFVDDMSTFLEVMRSINRRDLLVQHDLQALQSIQMMIDSEAGDEELHPLVRSVYGRDRVIDDLVRALRSGHRLDRTALIAAVEAAEDRLRAEA